MWWSPLALVFQGEFKSWTWAWTALHSGTCCDHWSHTTDTTCLRFYFGLFDFSIHSWTWQALAPLEWSLLLLWQLASASLFFVKTKNRRFLVFFFWVTAVTSHLCGCSSVLEKLFWLNQVVLCLIQAQSWFLTLAVAWAFSLDNVSFGKKFEVGIQILSLESEPLNGWCNGSWNFRCASTFPFPKCASE